MFCRNLVLLTLKICNIQNLGLKCNFQCLVSDSATFWLPGYGFLKYADPGDPDPREKMSTKTVNKTFSSQNQMLSCPQYC